MPRGLHVWLCQAFLAYFILLLYLFIYLSIYLSVHLSRLFIYLFSNRPNILVTARIYIYRPIQIKLQIYSGVY